MKMLENFFLALSAEPVLMFLNAANPSSLLRPMFLSVKLEFSSCSMKRPNSSQNFCSVETDHRHVKHKDIPFFTHGSSTSKSLDVLECRIISRSVLL